MPLQGYSVSYNPPGSPDQKSIEVIHHTMMKLNPVEYVITHEHTDQQAQGKDHLQIFFTLLNEQNTPACRITQKFAPNNKKPAFLCKLHKGDLSFGFGYCLKEVPETGSILYTNLTPERQVNYAAFYQLNKLKDTIVLSVPEQFFNWLREYIHNRNPELCKYAKSFTTGPYVWVPDFTEYWDRFVENHMDLIPSRADYYKCSLNFNGKFRGYHNSRV